MLVIIVFGVRRDGKIKAPSLRPAAKSRNVLPHRAPPPPPAPAISPYEQPAIGNLIITEDDPFESTMVLPKGGLLPDVSSNTVFEMKSQQIGVPSLSLTLQDVLDKRGNGVKGERFLLAIIGRDPRQCMS